jgi:histidine triad (HIT) family protein
MKALESPGPHLLMDLLFRIARSRYGWLIIGWIFAHMSFIIPVKRLRETDNFVVFHHPAPTYPVHILMVPKKDIGNLVELEDEDDDYLKEVFQIARSLVVELDLAETGYRLILNGGKFQDIPQLHFHLISGAPFRHDHKTTNPKVIDEA